MGLDNYINYAMKSILKNPILEVLQEIKITKILGQSNFIKRDVGYPPFQTKRQCIWKRCILQVY